MNQIVAVQDRDGWRVACRAVRADLWRPGWLPLLLNVPGLLLLWALVAPIAAVAQTTGPAPAPPLRVLMIASYDKDLPSQRHLEEGLATVLAGRPEGSHQLHVEYLDSARLDLAAQRAVLRPYLEARYGRLGVDVVVATSTQASDYLASEPELLPQARRIYADVPEHMLPRIRERQLQATLIAVQSNYPASLGEALRLSAPKRLVVIGETSDEASRLRLRLFQQAAATMLPTGVDLEYWLDRPVADLQQRAAALPTGAVIYFLLQFNDGPGRRITPYEVARRVSASASVPMFSQWETLVGSGVVGGYVTSHRLIGSQVGHAILRDAAPSGDSLRHAYDARALRRWGYDEAALAPGSLVMYREPSLLQQYRGLLLAAGLLFAGLLGLLALLLASRRARQRALVALAQERSLLSQRVGERTAELDLRVDELAHRNEELTRMKSQLSLLASTDGLTGLGNRRHLDAALGQELRRLQRQGGRLSLLMADVDCFKAYNDRYGHVDGDHCLQAIAALVARCARRPADTAARYGGEEFVLVLPDTPFEGARLLAQQLQLDLAALALPHEASSVARHVTLSIGLVSVGREPGLTAEALLAMVDAQMYRAKGDGRNCLRGLDHPGHEPAVLHHPSEPPHAEAGREQ